MPPGQAGERIREVCGGRVFNTHIARRHLPDLEPAVGGERSIQLTAGIESPTDQRHGPFLKVADDTFLCPQTYQKRPNARLLSTARSAAVQLCVNGDPSLSKNLTQSLQNHTCFINISDPPLRTSVANIENQTSPPQPHNNDTYDTVPSTLYTYMWAMCFSTGPHADGRPIRFLGLLRP